MLSTKLNWSHSPSGWDFIIIYDNLDGKTFFFFFSVNDDNLATTGTEFSSYTLLSYTYKQLFFWATETWTNITTLFTEWQETSGLRWWSRNWWKNDLPAAPQIPSCQFCCRDSAAILNTRKGLSKENMLIVHAQCPQHRRGAQRGICVLPETLCLISQFCKSKWPSVKLLGSVVLYHCKKEWNCKMNHIRNTIWRDLKNPEVSLTRREVLQKLAWTYSPHKGFWTHNSMEDLFGYCMFTYSLCQGWRDQWQGFALQWNTGFVGFLLNAHHNCLYNGLTQLQNQQTYRRFPWLVAFLP